MLYKPAIASMSLGRASHHTLPQKFTAAASSGLQAIEIFFEDLLILSSSYPGGSSPSNQILAARQIRSLCDSLNLEIMALGPFSNCDGILSDSARREKLEELELWFEIARILGTDIIQIPSTFQTEGMTRDMEIIISDLREIADIGARQSPPFRFAYENLCFATYIDTWESAWSVVKGVDRPNFGLCLDTFNIAGRGWADPASPSGKLLNADAVFKESLKNMAREVDVKKIFYVQVVDAERMERPLDANHPFYVEGQKPRMSWSRNARLFMCEEERGGYLPVVDVLKVICDEKEGLGYNGWISMEYFNRSLTEEGKGVPREHARRAMESWGNLIRIMKWEDKVESTVTRKAVAKVPTSCVTELGNTEISSRL